MTNQSREFTLSGYLAVLRRQRWLVLAVTLICGAAALGFSLLQKKTYQATASLAVSDPNRDLALTGGTELTAQTPLQLAAAASPQVTRQEVVNRVKRSLSGAASAGALRSSVQVAIDPNSYVIDVTASDRSAARAAAIANAFASADTALTTAESRAQFKSQAAAVQRQLRQIPKTQVATQLQTVETLTRLKNLSSVATPLQVSTVAAVPSSPSSPKPLRNTVAALIFGLLLGIALATARDALDRRLRHSKDVTQALDHPIVGHIRSEALGHAGSADQPADKLDPLDDSDEESFRILRQNVRYMTAAGDTRTLLVTSAMAEEGKSTVAACLAAANAQAGLRTLLVECDLRRPVLASRFGVKTSPGLTDYLTGHAEPHEILQPIAGLGNRTNGNGRGPAHRESSNLVCITSGTSVPRPAELLASERFRTFLDEVSKVYDSVILDTAPLLPVADTLSIIPDVASLLVCVRLKRTTRDQARAAQSALDRLPERPVGLVLTNVQENEDGYYYGYYGAPAPTAAQVR